MIYNYIKVYTITPQLISIVGETVKNYAPYPHTDPPV